MNIYNTLTHKIEKFVPNEPGKVSMYTCGPTVYHYAHIGNLRSYIMEDVLEKYLRYDGYDVKRVMNITDVGHLTSDGDTGDDKMLKGAKREHKTVMEIAKFYTDAFFEDCKKLNIKRLDIHCGGIDNAFPHHTNEIAQSEAYLGHKWCNYWFHILHLNTNSGKMSKSKGEFLTVSLLESKGYDPLVYRFFCLQSHYRKSLVFTYENLDNAKTAYNKLTARIAQLMADKKPDEVVELVDFEKFKGSFKAALDDDINTSNAITVLYDVLKADTNNETKLALIEDFDKVLSLGLIEAAKKLSADGEEDIPEEVKVLVEERKAARKAKDFAKADELRDKIGELGYIVEETRHGTKIKKK